MRRILLVFALLILAGAAAVYWFFSGDGMRRSLERQATAWLGQPVRIGSAAAQLFPRVAIQLNDVRVGEPVSLSLADVEVSTGLRPLLSRRIEDAEIIISDSRIEMPLKFSIPQSAGATAGGGTASGAGGVTVASIRAITLRDIRLAGRGREIVVSADSALTGPRLELSRFTARAGRTSLEASGSADLEPVMNAKLQVSANELDLDDLMALADAFTPPPSRKPATRSSPGALVMGRITAALSAGRARAGGVELTALRGSLLAQGNRLGLSNAAFELFGGRYAGALDAEIGERLTVNITSRIENLDVAQLAAFGGVPGTVTGRLSGSGRFTGRGADMAAVLASAAGNGSAAIVDGTIPRLNLVRTVILFFGRPAADAPPSAGDRFDTLTASFSLARQVVSAESFALDSPDVDIRGAGTLTIPTKALDGRAELLLSEALSAQAGTDLVRYTREGDRVLLPATIGGTLESPRVMIDAAAAVKRGLRNELERRMKGLFDRLKPPSQ
jgi:uncharacterized protein involved in outer membrane biogenesis